MLFWRALMYICTYFMGGSLCEYEASASVSRKAETFPIPERESRLNDNLSATNTLQSTQYALLLRGLLD